MGERSLSTYSETASKLSTQYHYILDCVQKRLLCTPSPLYVVTDTGATWLEGKPPSSWLESVQSEMRLAPYYFIILIFNSLKGRGKNSRFFQTLAKMGFFFIFGLDLGGAKGDCRFFESHLRF